MSGSTPNWSDGYVPTTAEWKFWFSQKQDFLNISQQTIIQLQSGLAVPNGIATLTNLGTLLPTQAPALTGDVTSTAGSPATTIGMIGGKTVSLSGNFTTSGAFPITLTATGTTNITLPTSGTMMGNPMTTQGDTLYGGSGGAATRLALGTTNTVYSAGASAPQWSSLSSLIDTLGSAAQGNVAYRGSGGWSLLAPGTSGQFLQTQGASANPQWATPSGSGNVLNSGTPVSGQIGQWVSSTSIQGTPFPALDAGGFLNKFRNAGFTVAQRGTSGTVTTGNTAYTLDGWMIAPTGATASWSQQYNANLTGNSLRIACASGMTACNIQQRIESFIAAGLLTYSKGLIPVTVQFAIYNNSGSTLTVKLATGYASVQDNFGTVTGDFAATNMQSVTNGTAAIVAYTFTPGSANLANGYQVQIQFGGGLNAGSGYVDIGFADIRIATGVTTGLNATPPPPEIRTASTEMLLSQRYYWDPAYGGSTAVLQLTTYTSLSSGNITSQMIVLPVPMRATPNLSVRNQSYTNASSVTLNSSSPSTINTYISASASGLLIANFNATASAEL